MENRQPETEPMEVIEEDDFRRYRGNNRKRKRAKWTPEETVRFFKALSLVGTDFSLMSKLFTTRTRKDLKVPFIYLLSLLLFLDVSILFFLYTVKSVVSGHPARQFRAIILLANSLVASKTLDMLFSTLAGQEMTQCNTT
jgi:hypothetical protein